MTGTSLPRKRASARSIVPSPPRTTAISAPLRSASGSPTPCFSTSSSGRRSSTPASRATFSSRSRAGPIVSGLPCVITAARRMPLPDRRGDPVVDVVGEVRAVTMDEVEEHFPVALGPRQARVYDPDRRGLPVEGGGRDLPHDAPPNLDVAHDPSLPHFGAAGFELRLDEDDSLPPRRGDREDRWEHQPEADERDVRNDELGRKRQLVHRARIHALEHDDSLVAAQTIVQLSVADVESDNARGPALQQDIREASGRRTDVDTCATGWIDAEDVERVCQFLAASGDVRRRLLDVDDRRIVDRRSGFVISAHAAGEHERLRLRATLGEAPLDEQHVEPFLHAATGFSSTSTSRSATWSNSGACLARSVSSGIRPRSETPSDQIERSGAAGSNTSTCSPQCGHSNPDMFSTPPSTRTSTPRRKCTNLRASRCATSCGPTTTRAPASATTPTSCCCRSAVPGGRSTSRTSSPVHSTCTTSCRRAAPSSGADSVSA